MAEFKFACQCGQNLQVDELWSGHQLECPGCHQTITVPAAPATSAPAKPAVVARMTSHSAPAASAPAPAPAAQRGSAPPVPAGPPKLAIGAAAHAEAPKPAPIVRSFVEPPRKKQSKIVAAIVPIIVLAALSVGGYYGYNYYMDKKKAKEEEEARQAAAAAEAAKPKPPPKPKELPVLPAVWSLDAAQAKFPESKANGMISGANFLVESARIDKIGAVQVLSLMQGPARSPDREVLIYLHLPPGGDPTNVNLTVSPDTKNPAISQIAKLWKKDPKYAPERKNFSTGYNLKLQLGQMTDNQIESKIFLALPDPEQSVVAGSFKTAMGVTAGDMTSQTQAAPTPAPRSDPLFEKRYGIKR